LEDTTVIEQVGVKYTPDAVRALIDDCLRRVHMHPDWLEKVVIASPDNYDRVRSEISAGVAQPLGPGMTSLGWTWARRANERVTCTVVLPVVTIDAALAGDPLRIFTICHELGHGKDFAARDTVSIPDTDHDEPFRLDAISAFQREKFLQEFGANRHAAVAVSPEHIDADVRHIGKMISRCRAIVQDFINGYRTKRVSNATLAFQVSGCAWEILISIGSVHGYLFADSPLVGQIRHELDRQRDDTEQRLRPVSGTITGEYPHVSPESLSRLQDVWRFLIDTWGFTIQGTLEGDRLTFPGHS